MVMSDGIVTQEECIEAIFRSDFQENVPVEVWMNAERERWSSAGESNIKQHNNFNIDNNKEQSNYWSIPLANRHIFSLYDTLEQYWHQRHFNKEKQKQKEKTVMKTNKAADDSSGW